METCRLHAETICHLANALKIWVTVRHIPNKYIFNNLQYDFLNLDNITFYLFSYPPAPGYNECPKGYNYTMQKDGIHQQTFIRECDELHEIKMCKACLPTLEKGKITY